MRNRRMVLFGIFRGAAAIFLALAVGAIFIFLSSKEPWKALQYLLIGPFITTGGSGIAFNTQNFYQILAAMIPTIFTGLPSVSCSRPMSLT